MAISYPLTMPSHGFVRIAFMNQDATAVVESPYTYQAQIQEHSGQRWVVEVTLPPMERATAAPWQAFLASLRGPLGTFYLGDPKATTPRGVATGTPLVNNAGNTGNELTTKGWTIDTADILKKGDYIQVGSRLYMVTTDCPADHSGLSTLNIWPRIRESPANNETIITTNCKGLFRLTRNETPLFEYALENHYSMSFIAVEAL
jgi:hypothetical protein